MHQRKRRGYQDFPPKIFSLTVPKCFIGEHFGVSEKFLYQKFSCIGGGGGITVFQNFLSHMTQTKSFVQEPFCFPETFWYREKFMDKRGHITIFSRNFFVSQCRKLSQGNPTVFEKIFGFKKFYEWKGGITFFRRKFLVPQCRKFSWASLQCFRNFGVSKNFTHSTGYHNFPSKIFCLIMPKNFGGIPSMFQKIWDIEKVYA